MKSKVLLYCTKAEPYLARSKHLHKEENPPYIGKFDTVYCNKKQKEEIEDFILNGKIVASCEIDKVEFYEMEYYKNNLVLNQISKYDELESKEWEHDCFKRVISNENTDEEIANCELLKKSCLSFDGLGSYVCPKEGINNFYALHLTNLKVFDELKELAKHTLDNNSDFYIKKWIKKFDSFKGSALTKAPQNMCYCYDRFGNEYILISIQPQHLCNILNGEKTIEVRRKVLNCLKGDLKDEY